MGYTCDIIAGYYFQHDRARGIRDMVQALGSTGMYVFSRKEKG